jgi:hypothetical protein
MCRQSGIADASAANDRTRKSPIATILAMGSIVAMPLAVVAAFVIRHAARADPIRSLVHVELVLRESRIVVRRSGADCSR